MRDRLKAAAVSTLDFAPLRALVRPLYAGEGVIFTLHRVVENPLDTLVPGIAITIDFLRVLVETIRGAGREIIPLSEVSSRFARGSHGKRWACLTFDDGYLDNLTLASPLMARLSVPYTLFLVSDWVMGRATNHAALLERLVQAREYVEVPFGERRIALSAKSREEKLAAYAALDVMRWREPQFNAAIPTIMRDQGFSPEEVTAELFLLREQAIAISGDGCAEIGSHTVGHAALAHLPHLSALAELRDSRSALGALLGRTPDLIAYPYGSRDQCGPREFAMADECGYRVGVTTRLGNVFGSSASQPLSLPRTGLSLHGHSHTAAFVRAVLDGTRNAFMNRGRRTRDW
jgi:peptidoglycan/xylan/chitin deacetylase (PgdA/CDA1 family)